MKGTELSCFDRERLHGWGEFSAAVKKAVLDFWDAVLYNKTVDWKSGRPVLHRPNILLLMKGK